MTGQQKNSKKKDLRIPRIWFLSLDNWSSENEKPEDRYQQIQCRAKKNYKAKVFLVRAPLTFGHSQLVMKFPSNKEREAEHFYEAASIIKKAITVFRTELKKVHKKQEFADLGKLTLTPGNSSYLKTLVLRTSAKEKTNEYKVHLVPYFQSHASACQKQYTTTHCLDPDEEGGLLGWLGKRETEVDIWQVGNNPSAYMLDKIVNERFKMTELAKILCEAWPSK